MKDWNISAGRKYTDNIFQLDERSTYVPLPAPPRVSLLPPPYFFPSPMVLKLDGGLMFDLCSLSLHPSIHLSILLLLLAGFFPIPPEF